MINLNVRLNLTDVINCGWDGVDTILDALSKTGTKLNRPVKLKLWYDFGISIEVINQFIKKCEHMKISTTTIIPSNKISANTLVWFDIVSVHKRSKDFQVRYEYLYSVSSLNTLLEGINYFYKVADFCTTLKAPKIKQKRTD